MKYEDTFVDWFKKGQKAQTNRGKTPTLALCQINSTISEKSITHLIFSKKPTVNIIFKFDPSYVNIFLDDKKASHLSSYRHS